MQQIQLLKYPKKLSSSKKSRGCAIFSKMTIFLDISSLNLLLCLWGTGGWGGGVGGSWGRGETALSMGMGWGGVGGWVVGGGAYNFNFLYFI